MLGTGRINFAAKGIDISKARGGKMLCPKCTNERKNKNDKSLSVDKERGVFNCHHCGWKGSAMEYDRPEREKKIYARPKPKPAKPADAAIEWFKSRGISEATLTAMQVTQGAAYMPQTNGERGCICFNYYRGGELINIKYRDREKHFRMEKDAELIFYNLDSIKPDSDSAVIVEGEMDALTLIEAGINFPVLSVPNGASKGNQRLEYLDNCFEELIGLSSVIIATDNDEAGLALREELSRRLGKDRCLTVRYPSDCKDFNEVLMKYGKRQVLEVFKTAEYYPIDGLEKPNDHYEDALNIFQHGFPEYPSIGMGDLDELIKFDPSGFTVITGVPGHGKSTFLSNVLMQLSKSRGWKHALFTPEMKPHHFATNILVSIYTQRGIRDGMTLDEYNHAYSFVNDHFTYINSESVECTVEGLLKKAAEMVQRYGVNSVVLDPWNYIQQDTVRGESETAYICRMLAKVKVFKEKYGCHVFIVAHPAKIQTETGKATFKVPSMYDISGSAHWFNMMDNGITVYRNTDENRTEVHVKKIRWSGISGKVGIAHFDFDWKCSRFTPQNGLVDLLPPSNPLAGITPNYQITQHEIWDESQS